MMISPDLVKQLDDNGIDLNPIRSVLSFLLDEIERRGYMADSLHFSSADYSVSLEPPQSDTSELKTRSSKEFFADTREDAAAKALLWILQKEE